MNALISRLTPKTMFAANVGFTSIGGRDDAFLTVYLSNGARDAGFLRIFTDRVEIRQNGPDGAPISDPVIVPFTRQTAPESTPERAVGTSESAGPTYGVLALGKVVGLSKDRTKCEDSALKLLAKHVPATVVEVST